LEENTLLVALSSALARSGLIVRGGFNFDAGENAPSGPAGGPARSLLLVGQAGSAPWPYFKIWLGQQPKIPDNPLDSWSREVIGAVARRFEARAVSPSDRPYHPFQQWAMRAEGLKPSPLGILMHPHYGLWHAYRGALLFNAALELPRAGPSRHLCEACAGKPCLHSCPVDAFSSDTFAHEACVGHVRGKDGAACLGGGCLARNACPYGREYRYPGEVQAFHMRAFIR
jgi:ferredoxin